MNRRVMQQRGLVEWLALLLFCSVVTGCSTGKRTSTPLSPEVKQVTLPSAERSQDHPPAAPVHSAPQLPGVVGVMVENSEPARPQMGLDKADIVYELEAEYGITRFLALFYQQKSDIIGPVRSARMGFYDVATAYRMPYAHAGGNSDVLLELKDHNRSLLNIDEIYSCGSCFWRSGERSAPHNLYTSTDRLVNYSTSLGFVLQPLYWYSEGGTMAGGKPAPEIAFDWGPKTQSVSWSWTGKRYARSQSGAAHLMADGAHIEAENIIVIFTEYHWNSAAQQGEGQNDIEIVGSGTGYLFRDGLGYPIHWSKPARTEHYHLTTPNGGAIQLTVGKTWFEVLKTPANLTRGIAE